MNDQTLVNRDLDILCTQGVSFAFHDIAGAAIALILMYRYVEGSYVTQGVFFIKHPDLPAKQPA